MAQATTTPAAAIPKTFSNRLRRLRTKILAWFLVDGLSRVLLCVVLVIGLDLLVDWLFHLDRPQRAVMLVLAVGAAAAVFYRRVVRPLSCRLSDDALCLQIEDRNQQLRQGLISAVQFARMDDFESRGTSPALVRATIDRAMQQTADVRFEGILRRDRFIVNVALLAVALAALVGVGVSSAANDSMAIWFDRNVLLGDLQWPQDVHLVVRGVVWLGNGDGRLTIPRGDDWPLVVTVRDDSRRLPKMVYVDFRGGSGWRPDSGQSRPMHRAGDRQFQTTLRNVVEAFEFRARCRGASTAWITVELVDRPSAQQFHLAATSPKYAGGETEPLPPGMGPYYVLKGSTLEVRGTANKRLSKAILVAGNKRHEMTVTGGRDFGTSLPAGDVGAGVYHVELTDTERLVLPGASEPGPLSSKHPTSFTLKIKPDREPRVVVKPTGVGMLVVPGARIPLDCRIRDDYLITAARLRHQWRGESSDEGSQGVDPLDEFTRLANRASAAFQSDLELPPLQIPAGSRLSFFVEADDNDDVSGPKSGKSTTIVLRVVSEDELRTDLLRREKQRRLEFQRYLKQQEDVLTECESMLAGVRAMAKLETAQRQLLVRLQKRQKLLGANLAALAGRLEGIVAEVQNNRLEEDGGPLQRRLLDRIIQPMWMLADDAIPQAARHVDRAWRLSGDRAHSPMENKAERNRALSDAIAAQQSILATMREILSHLVKAEGFQEAVNLLYEIQRAQKDVLDLTDQQRQERIRKILDEGGRAGNHDDER